MLTLEIDRDTSLEIWTTKNDKIFNFGCLKCFKIHCLGLQKKSPSGTWVIEKKVHWPAASRMERWAVDSLIIMINYYVQGIELLQKLYIELEYMVPKVIGKSSSIDKVVQKFSKFSQKIKAVYLSWVKILKVQGLREKPSNPQNLFLEWFIL